MFQLIFKGECIAGVDPVAARNSARQLFKASDAQLDRMFNGQPVVIRNDLDQTQAEKYRALLQKHGMRAYVKAMGADQAVAAANSPKAARPEVARTPQAQPQRSSAGAAGRLPIAGERTEAVLAGSSLALDPPGVTLASPRRVQAPRFDNLDAWSVAPPGSDIGSQNQMPPLIVPDTSHLEVEPLPPIENDR